MAFGDFTWLCQRAPLPICSVVGPIATIEFGTGIEADCYCRPIEVANTIIFQGATSFMHIVALVMTVIMILHVRSKFTAVGRKEITTFFYLYMAVTFVSLILDAGVIPPDPNGAYPYFVAVQCGLTAALCVCLLINGFVGFQLYEDGTTLSVWWVLRGISFLFFAITFFVAVATFRSLGALGPNSTVVLFIFLYIIPGICLLVYALMQIILVTRTLEDRWPLGDILFGCFFFIVGQVILYVLSVPICQAVQHYLDGLFFATICNLLAVMMIYKVNFARGCINDLLANAYITSTGTQSRKKISSSRSEQSRTTGRSRNSSPKTSAEARCIRTPIMRAASIASHTRRNPMLAQLAATKEVVLVFETVHIVDGRFRLRLLLYCIGWRLVGFAYERAVLETRIGLN
jgi:hypothetical protein